MNIRSVLVSLIFHALLCWSIIAISPNGEAPKISEEIQIQLISIQGYGNAGSSEPSESGKYSLSSKHLEMESVEDSDFGKTADKEIQKTVQSEFVASPANAAKIGSAGIEGNNAAFSSKTLAQKAEQRVSRHRRYAENKDVRKEHSVMPRETGVLSEKKDNGVRTSEGGGTDTVSLGKQGSAVEDVSFGGASGPAFRRFVQPDYPLRARRTGVSGKVLLQVLLDEHGRVLEIKTLSGNDMLVESAVAAIRKSSFFPLMKNSKPVPCQTVIPIRFTLE